MRTDSSWITELCCIGETDFYLMGFDFCDEKEYIEENNEENEKKEEENAKYISNNFSLKGLHFCHNPNLK